MQLSSYTLMLITPRGNTDYTVKITNYANTIMPTDAPCFKHKIVWTKREKNRPKKVILSSGPK